MLPMFLGTISIGAPEWFWPALAIFITGLVLIFFSYRKTAAPLGIRLLAVSLKICGLALLAVSLLDPRWNGQRAVPGANYFLIVADNSQGMKIHDRGSSISRGESLKTILTEKSKWQEALASDFQLRRYFFDSQLQSTKDFSELNFNGHSTALATSLTSLAERFRKQPVAGILLLSDGNATDAIGELSFAGLPPVYPVVMGKNDLVNDLAIGKVQVNQSVFEDAPVTIQAEITAHDVAGSTVFVELIDVSKEGGRIKKEKPAASKGNPKADPPKESSGKPQVVARQTKRTSKKEEALTFRFEVKPPRSGLLFYQLKTGLESSGAAEKSKASEATLANNERILVVDRGHGPYRVLYVSGRPNWEYKFLNRAISEDDDVEMVGLIRMARREPKFDFRGRSGESSNPLFRGFGTTTEETERYDKPVLIRLNTRDDKELKGGFPLLAEELYPYHAVIVDDLESEFFTHDQMLLLQKFVSERGGGFFMLGGQESFQEGKYHRTPIGDMLPLYLDKVVEGNSAGAVRLALTQEGWLEPWVRLRSTEMDENQRLSEMSGFLVWNRLRDWKPGATVLAQVVDRNNTPFPALAVQRFGFGRTGALVVGDLWRWGLQDPAMQKDLFKAWRQLVRWMVADAPKRLEVHQVNKPGNVIEIQVRAKDPKFQPLENATVRFQINPATSLPDSPDSPGSTNEVEMMAESSLSEPGLYTATFAPRDNRAYRAEIRAFNSTGVEEGVTEAGWHRNPAEEEFRSLQPNRSLLELVARKTGGKIIEPGELKSFVEELPHKKVPLMENWSRPLWHQSSIFLLAICCFALEWGLRRSKGLA